MSKIHLEILDKQRQEVFGLLTHFKRFGYLAGGTALALQIQHRKSFDFDIFVDKPIATSLKTTVKEVFGAVDYYVNSVDQISFRTKNNIQITFLWYYFKPLFPLIPTDSIALASIKDITTDKAYTIGRRAAWRDYVDFFFLLKNQFVTLEEIIKLGKKKFGGEFNEVLLLPQLTYFADVAETPIDYIGQSYTSTEVTSYLEHAVAKYSKNLLR